MGEIVPRVVGIKKGVPGIFKRSAPGGWHGVKARAQGRTGQHWSNPRWGELSFTHSDREEVGPLIETLGYLIRSSIRTV